MDARRIVRSANTPNGFYATADTTNAPRKEKSVKRKSNAWLVGLAVVLLAGAAAVGVARFRQRLHKR